MRTDVKKVAFLEAYAKTLGDIGKSIQAVKMSRSGFYKWYKDDKNFREECESIEAGFIDFCESKVRERIIAGEWIPLKYYLENRAARRWRNVDVASSLDLAGQLTVHITKEILTGPAQ